MSSFQPNPDGLDELTHSADFRAGLRQSADGAADWARDHAPVDEGELRDSIEVEETDDGFRVVVGTDHWLFPEFGTSRQEPQPYMRPSIEGAGLNR